MKRKMNGNINWWKWACLLVLAINFAFWGVVASRLIQPRESETLTSTTTTDSVKVGTFTTNSDQLNETLNAYLEDYQSNGFSYQFYATKSELLFEGTYTLLGYEIPLYVYFQPSRLESGAIQLTVTSVSAGTLSLPESEILKYIKSSYDLPDFVTIDAANATILINLPEIDNAAGIYLEATSIDLVNDTFTFDIYKKTTEK